MVKQNLKYMRRPAVLVLGLALLAACSGVPFMSQPEPSVSVGAAPIVLDQPRQLTDWTLPSSTGSDLSLSSLRGKHAVLFFGYTHCPDFCPTTLGDYKLVKRELGSDADKVDFVFVSVDPERDTPEVLKQYVATFDPSFIGVAGDAATLDAVSKEYSMYYKLRKDEASWGNYPVDHTTLSYLVDPEGRLVALYPYEMSPEQIAADLKQRIHS
jgi:protein SCO1